MPVYGFAGLNEAGNLVSSALTATTSDEALGQAQASCRHLVDLYRVVDGPERREVSLLGELNLPLPERLSLSWLPLPGRGRVPRVRFRRLAELLRQGELPGSTGLFSLTVSTKALLELSLRRVRNCVFESVRLTPAPATVGSTTVRGHGDEAADDEIDEIIAGMAGIGTARAKDLRREAQGSPPRRWPQDYSDLGSSRAGDWLEDGVDERFTDDPPPLWRLCALLIEEAMRPGSGTRFDTLRVFPEPEACMAQYSCAGEPPVDGERPPARLHSSIVVCLAASVGIIPTSLPPQRAEVPLQIDGRDFVVTGETRMTDWGEAITIRWRAG